MTDLNPLNSSFCVANSSRNQILSVVWWISLSTALVLRWRWYQIPQLLFLSRDMWSWWCCVTRVKLECIALNLKCERKCMWKLVSGKCKRCVCEIQNIWRDKSRSFCWTIMCRVILSKLPSQQRSFCVLFCLQSWPFLVCWLLFDLFHAVDTHSDGLLAPSSGHYSKPNLYFPGS